MYEFRILAKFGDKNAPREFLSPDIRISNPGWGDANFSRPIEELHFYLPGGKVLVMAGMEKYNFFVEAMADMRGRGGKLHAIYFACKEANSDKVHLWRIGDGKVIHSLHPFGKEYNGTATSGWKIGVPSSTLINKIIGV